MIKRILKIVGVLVLALIVLIIAAPFFFQDQIADVIKNKLNASLDAQVDFANVDLSLISSFPDARVSIEEISIINKEPFIGDTLFYGKSVKLDMPIGDLFNDASEPISINELQVDNAVAHLLVNKNGDSNWDIAKSTASTDQEQPADDTSDSGGFNFNIKHYEINKSELQFIDAGSKNTLILKELNHEGNGDFSLETSELNTTTDALAFYKLDEIEYLSGQAVKLDATLGLDLTNQKYTFLENKAFINDLPLALDGYVDLEEESILMDLNIKTPSSDFKNFLAVIPETYRSNLDGVTTTGDFNLTGSIKGTSDENTIPLLDFKVASNNASFQYPDLPRKVENIAINARLLNTTGVVEDTYLDIENVAFNIGADRLKGKARVSNFTTNMLVDMQVDGTLDMKNLSQSIPLPDGTQIDGKVNTDLSANFDMNSVEQERYERIKTQGMAQITDFNYNSTDLAKPLNIETATINMSGSNISLKDFKAASGNTDLAASGSIDNLIGFMFQDQDLKGAFKVRSNRLDTSDFMVETTTPTATTTQKETTTTSTTTEAVKIPAFLDANLDFNAKQVLYDGMELNNVSGVALVRDETLTLNNTQAQLYAGTIGVDGSVSTKGTTPVFNMNLNMKDLDIVQSVTGMNMLQQFVPLLKTLKGKLNTDLKFSGNLNNDMSPDLSTLAGNAFAQLLTTKIETANNPLLARLDDKLSFIDLSNLNLSDLATQLTFKDGAVQIAPFNFKVKDINVTASGSHSLTNDMNYTMALNVPARYLGKEGASLLAKLEDKDLDAIEVPVPITLGGSFTSPNVNVDLKRAVTNLSNQIIEIQKARLKDKGEDAVNNAVDDILKGNNPLDNIKDVLNGTKKPKDSTAVTTPVDTTKTPTVKEQASDKVKEAAGDLLNGLFKKKKKD